MSEPFGAPRYFSMVNQPLMLRLLLCVPLLAVGLPSRSLFGEDPLAESPEVSAVIDVIPHVAGVAWIELSGTLPESVEPPGLLGTLRPNLRLFIDRLDQACHDDRILAIVLRPQQTMLGRGQIHELQQAILRVRDAGKRVYAELQIATPSDYLVASACNEIRMPESAFLLLPGVRAEVMFYRELLSKLQIEADMLQVGDYKGAAEPYLRTTMSPEFRGQFTQLIDDLFDQLIHDVALRRNLKIEDVQESVDQGMLTATEAHRRGLIDRVCYADATEAQLQQDLGITKIREYRRYGKPDLDTDFSGMSGFLRMVDLFASAPRKSKGASDTGKVAVVYATGPIMQGKSQGDLFGQETVGGDTIVDALQKAEADSKVAAIVLRIDSPGGSALASDLIWQQVSHCQKPVVASMGNMAASGGYYIAMGCDKILAEPGTITGSIGVVGGKLALGGLFEKIGISTEVISKGQNAGIFSTQEKFSPSERTAMQAMMEDVYHQFVAKAAQSRGKTVEAMQPLAEGRLWTGRQAAGNGLVDATGTLRDAIQEAARLAGLSSDQPAELLILPQPKNFFERMFENPQALSPSSSSLTASHPSVAHLWHDLQAFQQLSQEPVLLWLPFQIEIK